ncbi:MAG: hypothetical protein GY835_22845 [bacterium]|nr:hypothetical protein [bacterium]
MNQIRVNHDAEQLVQLVLLKLRAQLRESAAELEQLCQTLPEPAEDFDARAELRGTLECVLTDLLEDAVSTLRVAAKRTEEEWRLAFEQRSQLLVNESEES